MDACGVCKWPDPTISIKFIHLIRATWAPEDLRRLIILTAAAMLPKTPRP